MMKKNGLSQWFAVSSLGALLFCAGVGIREAAAIGEGSNSSAPLNDPSDVAAIKQIGRDMGDAMVAVDIDKLDQIFADDWSATGISGKVVTKEKILRDFKSGADKLVAYELGPIDVQVLGNFAVAHGSVTEQRLRDGKDASGQGVYMDLLEKRAGKWVVVRSGGAFIKHATPSD
jgi:ketosteroid isomerase-like protein